MKPSHVNEDGTMCRHCGGMVGEDGFAPLGEAEEFEPVEGADTDQHEATERMRDASGFADAVHRMPRKGYADGGEVWRQPQDVPTEEESKEMRARTMALKDAQEGRLPAEVSDEEIEMKRRKMERYGFRSKL